METGTDSILQVYCITEIITLMDVKVATKIMEYNESNAGRQK